MAQLANKVEPRRFRSPSLIGWNGIYLEVPPEWNLALVAGGMEQGHLRVDGPNDVHVRVKWKRVKGKADLKRNLDRYLKLVRRKSKAGFEINHDIRLPVQRDRADRKPIFFSWKGEAQAVGMIWHCPSCGRVTIAQVDGPGKRNLTLLASQVLGTLEDHALDGYHTWGVYGLAADIPADFALTQNRLLSGYIQLHFSRGRSDMLLDRWGLADVALRKVSLEEWVKSRYTKLWKNYRCEINEAEVRGHPGLVVNGDLRSIRERVTAVLLRLVKIGAPTHLTQYVWTCELTNRICSVLVHHSRDEEGLAEEVTGSYVCHT
ncbi:MAG TPA: hypothetical protein VFJ58_00440 [Armatimonadota bacterium]|nr:hypothetical protein [Armatimonadota bacterium]